MNIQPCHPLGLHRVVSPVGALPQSALRLDNTPRIGATEILVDVETLNITSGSFIRMRKAHKDNAAAIAQEIMDVVQERGKYQDKLLGSGGMLIGTVAEVGAQLVNKADVRPGDRIATLLSLSATPLHLEEVIKVDLYLDQVHVRGQAMLFEDALYCRIPDDLPPALSLAVMDVAGAPAKVARTVTAGQTVFIMGGGKAGLLCMHEAMKRVGATGRVIALEFSPSRCEEIQALGLAHHVLNMDATHPVEVMQAVENITQGHMADFTVNVLNSEMTEMTAILSTNDAGQVFFYNTSTSFSRAALGAESAKKTVELVMGNGYIPGHAELTFQILRESHMLQHFFTRIYTHK